MLFKLRCICPLELAWHMPSSGSWEAVLQLMAARSCSAFQDLERVPFRLRAHQPSKNLKWHWPEFTTQPTGVFLVVKPYPQKQERKIVNPRSITLWAVQLVATIWVAFENRSLEGALRFESSYVHPVIGPLDPLSIASWPSTIISSLLHMTALCASSGCGIRSHRVGECDRSWTNLRNTCPVDVEQRRPSGMPKKLRSVMLMKDDEGSNGECFKVW